MRVKIRQLERGIFFVKAASSGTNLRSRKRVFLEGHKMAFQEFRKFLEKPDTLHNDNDDDGNNDDDDSNDDDDGNDWLFPGICENPDGIFLEADHNFSTLAICFSGI